MPIEKILQLSAAGFTAEQITALMPYIAQPAPAPAAQPAPAPAAQPAAAPAVQPAAAPAAQPAPAPAAPAPAAQPAAAPAAPAPAAQPAPAPAEPTMGDLLRQMADLSARIAASNIAASNQPAPTGASAEDALASIVIPTKK